MEQEICEVRADIGLVIGNTNSRIDLGNALAQRENSVQDERRANQREMGHDWIDRTKLSAPDPLPEQTAYRGEHFRHPSEDLRLEVATAGGELAQHDP